MLPTTAIQLLATYCANGVPGLKTHYPAAEQVTAPALNLFWEETENFLDLDPTRWTITVRGQLMVAALGTASKELLRAEQLIAPIADVFTPNDVGSAAYLLEDASTGDRVDYCYLARAVASQEITVPSGKFYGAELFFHIAMRRLPGSM
jgi:hypothetical protein